MRTTWTFYFYKKSLQNSCDLHFLFYYYNWQDWSSIVKIDLQLYIIIQGESGYIVQYGFMGIYTVYKRYAWGIHTLKAW